MANRIEGVTEKLEEIAKREFLEKGFAGASLRTIAENAGTTPRSIYTRYGDKEGLFAALVAPAAEGLKTLVTNVQEGYHEKPVDTQKQLFHDEVLETEYEGTMNAVLRFIYDDFETFMLLICCAEGTEFATYVEELAELDAHYTELFIKTTGNDVFSSGRASKNLLHLLSSAYMHGFFEIVRHNMPLAEAIAHVNQLRRFYECGWDDLLNPSKP